MGVSVETKSLFVCLLSVGCKQKRRQNLISGTTMSDVTRILNAIEQGDAGATEKLLPLVYEGLRLWSHMENVG